MDDLEECGLEELYPEYSHLPLAVTEEAVTPEVTVTEKIRWGEEITPEIQQRITGLINRLPTNIKLNVREFSIGRSGLRADEFGIYYPRLGRVKFRTASFTDDTFYHEIGHSIFADAIDRGDIAFLGKVSPEFAKWQKGKIAELRQLYPKASYLTDSELLYKYDFPFRDIEESFASVFSAYVRGLTIEPSVVTKMLERMFPKAKDSGRRFSSP